MKLFTVGEVVNHAVGDRQCPECADEYPEPCPCGGFMHAAETAEADAEGNLGLVTCCDRCGRSEDQLDEAAS